MLCSSAKPNEYLSEIPICRMQDKIQEIPSKRKYSAKDEAAENRFLQRYSRHLMLAEIGEAGQQRLATSSVAVFGAGGLGSAALFYLAASGVGSLHIIDPDTVSLDNLQRQILYAMPDLGRAKSHSAKDTLTQLNPDIEIVARQTRIDRQSAEALLQTCDLALDCSDNFPARDALNSACLAQGKPLISAAAIGFNACLIRLQPGRGSSPCYRCLHPQEPIFINMPRCDTVGIFAPSTGVIGSMQAAEALKCLLGRSSRLESHLLWYDALAGQFHEFACTKNPKCPTCA